MYDKLKKISYKITAVAVTAIIVGLAGILFVNPVFAQGNITTTQIPTMNCVEAITPMGPKLPGDFPQNLVFAFERGGGLAGPAISFERTSYDSLTQQLVSITALGSPKIIILSGPQQMCLEDAISASGFFESKNEFPGKAPDVFTYSLAIMLNNRTHTVSWTDVSEGVPPGILEIVKQIGNLAAQ